MRMIASLASAITLLVTSAAGPASANYTYSVSGILFESDVTSMVHNETLLSGTFTTDSTNTTVISYDIVVPAGTSTGPSGPIPSPFSGFEYTPGDSTITKNLTPLTFGLNTSIAFQIDSPGSVDELQINFNYALNPTAFTPWSYYNGTYEKENGVGPRFNFYGGATPLIVPEPASIALTGSALAIALAGAWVRRRRSA